MCNDKGEGKMGSYAGGVGWGCGCVWAGGGRGIVMGLFGEQMENCRMQKGRGD